MKPVGREIVVGILAIIIPVLLIFGAASLSILEDQSANVLLLTEISTSTANFQPSPEIHTAVIIATQTQKNTPTGLPPTHSNPTATRCAIPQGWEAYIIKNGDGLETLAIASNLSVVVLKKSNCLATDSLVPGATLYLPMQLPTATLVLTSSPTPRPCSLPSGWVEKTLQPGENLLDISLRYNIRITDIIAANCYENAAILRTGDRIFVPRLEIAPTAVRIYTSTHPILTPTLSGDASEIPMVATSPSVVTTQATE